MTLLFLACLGLTYKPQQLLLRFHFSLQQVMSLSNRSLTLEALKLFFQLTQNVLHAD